MGEASPDGRWGESPASVIAQLEKVELASLGSPFDLEGVTDLLPPGSARSALDTAMHDLAARCLGVSLTNMLGLGGRALPQTSVTVPIADIETMVTRTKHLSDHPILKVKVGFEGDVEAIGAMREVYDGEIRVDANEGWSEAEAIERLEHLAPFRIQLCEQPIRAGDHESLHRVTEASSIPIYADEDVGTARDVAALVGAVDGVNLKLRKAGGIREAIRAVSVAKANEMGTMLGWDLESGVAAAAGAAIAPLFDHIDLDGPLLLAEDPYPFVRYERGTLEVVPRPGLGGATER